MSNLCSKKPNLTQLNKTWSRSSPGVKTTFVLCCSLLLFILVGLASINLRVHCDYRGNMYSCFYEIYGTFNDKSNRILTLIFWVVISSLQFHLKCI